MSIYVPNFDGECWRCEAGPTVGLATESGLQDTRLCGACFFQDRLMLDWEWWNEDREETE
jgi:hypothetical protein